MTTFYLHQPHLLSLASDLEDCPSGRSIPGAIVEQREEPQRLTPTVATTRKLYLWSGNRCYMRDCDTALIDLDGALVGEIAHIEAAMPDGPRFNFESSNEARRQFENLMLLCSNCHEKIDQNVAVWTVEVLRDLKSTHEAIYSGSIQKLRASVSDVTRDSLFTEAQNGLLLPGFRELSPEERTESLSDVNALAQRLARVPYEARGFLAETVLLGEPDGINDRYVVKASVLEGALQIGSREVLRLVEILMHYGLGSLDVDPFEGGPEVYVGPSTGGVGWNLFADIVTVSAGDEQLVLDVVRDLDFARLDDEPLTG